MTVLILVAVIALVAAGPVMAQRHGPGPLANLNLTTDQRARLQKHLRDTGQKISGIRSDLRDARGDLFGQLSQYRVDEGKLNDTIHRIGSLQSRLLNTRLESQIALRQILNKDQFQQLSQAINERGMAKGEGGFIHGDEDIHPSDIQSLNLSSDQQERIKRLWRSSQRTMSDLRDQFRSASSSLADMYLNYDLDAKQARQRISDLNDVQMSILKATVSRQLALRKILTEDQFSTLVSAIRTSHPRQ